MAAGMHAAVVLRAVAESVGLLQGEGIHIGAQADAALAAAVANHADQAGGAKAAMDLDAPGSEVLRHHVGSPFLLEAKLRMGVDVASDAADLGLRLKNFGDECHDAS